jgi:hypothetical protein
VLLQYLSAPLVIAISGLACILAGLGGLVSPSLRQLQPGSQSRECDQSQGNSTASGT